MDLDIRSPLDATLLPCTIAAVVETGGIRHSDFITDCVSQWTAYPDDCPLCYGQLDSNSDDARDSVWDYLGRGQSQRQDRYIMTTPPCGHHYHAGCLHKATDQGSGYNTCLVCRAKWFDTTENLQKARNVNYVIQHSHATLTAIIALARANDGAEVGVLNFLTRLSARATGVIFGVYPKSPDQDPCPEAVVLQHFATEVPNMGFGHYLTG
ncbi:hypothetical protein HII31_01670 [Pseudocercospora fuligena]|uniref:RING-type domain-containing protein n=1 Tax=Pseudocercospora fuligena TaxID=685502 RepID=A0A8H6VS93_9PEZI|nr:hypothetical protein HII31_01670 [Pseudocercospora fuligena]